jgi:hypothetical protein
MNDQKPMIPMMSSIPYVEYLLLPCTFFNTSFHQTFSGAFNRFTLRNRYTGRLLPSIPTYPLHI